MKKQIVGGFVMKDLGKVNSKRDEIAVCNKCGKYKTQSQMKVVDKRYNCIDCNEL